MHHPIKKHVSVLLPMGKDNKQKMIREGVV